MSTGSAVSPITRAEVAALYDCRCEEVREALESCLSLLGDLYQRHTGSMFNVRFLDEEVALGLLHESMETLRDADPFWQRMAENAARYLGLKAAVEKDGQTDAVRARARAAVDQLAEQWMLVVSYPEYVQSAAALVEPALRGAL